MESSDAVEAAGRDVDAVLRRLPVLDTYRANVFRIAGLPTDADATAVRRRREEATMAARLGTAPSSPFGEFAPDPAPDADALKDAFEALQSPVTRLVHEALWLSGSGEPGATGHDAAVAAHCRALTAETAPDTGDGPEAVAARDEQWRAALEAWARTLADPEFWAVAAARARALDDPRVTAATVAALRTRLPQRIAGISAQLAVAAADSGGAPARHLRLLRESPFPPDLVARALRDALAPATDGLHDDCAAALRAAAETPQEAPAAARKLLGTARPPLARVAAVLSAGPGGGDGTDALAASLHDEVAGALVRCAVAHFNATGESAPALAVLESAADLARAATTVEQVERNHRAIADAGVLAVLEPWRETGDVDGAAEVLRIWRGQAPDPELRDHLDRLLADPRAVRADVGDTPSRAQFLGCGVRPFGHRAYVDETWVETRCVTVFGAPVYPLGAYLSDDDFVYAKVPMSGWTRIAQVAIPMLAVLLVVLVAFGPLVDLAVAVAALAVLAAATGLRRRQVRDWLADRARPGAERTRELPSQEHTPGQDLPTEGRPAQDLTA